MRIDNKEVVTQTLIYDRLCMIIDNSSIFQSTIDVENANNCKNRNRFFIKIAKQCDPYLKTSCKANDAYEAIYQYLKNKDLSFLTTICKEQNIKPILKNELSYKQSLKRKQSSKLNKKRKRQKTDGNNNNDNCIDIINDICRIAKNL